MAVTPGAVQAGRQGTRFARARACSLGVQGSGSAPVQHLDPGPARQSPYGCIVCIERRREGAASGIFRGEGRAQAAGFVSLQDPGLDLVG